MICKNISANLFFVHFDIKLHIIPPLTTQNIPTFHFLRTISKVGGPLAQNLLFADLEIKCYLSKKKKKEKKKLFAFQPTISVFCSSTLCLYMA